MGRVSVLIVGAGAMGLVNGYYLQLGGAEVTFLVRPGKKMAGTAPTLLYCYDDGALKTFDGYRVEDDMAALGDVLFDYALVTLDHALCVSDEGSALLKTLGKMFANTKTVLVTGGVGIGLREHIIMTTGLPEERIINGGLTVLCHQSSADLPVNSPTDAALLKKSRVAYRHLSRVSLVLDDMFPQTANAIAELYNRSGESSCAVIDKALFAVRTNSAFPMLAAGEIAGWPGIRELMGQGELWALSCEAQREVASLPQFGMGDAAVARLMSNEALGEAHLQTEQACLPLNYQQFNRFHHGGKVSGQNLLVMRKCAEAGKQAGRQMSALSEIIERLLQVRR